MIHRAGVPYKYYALCHQVTTCTLLYGGDAWQGGGQGEEEWFNTDSREAHVYMWTDVGQHEQLDGGGKGGTRES